MKQLLDQIRGQISSLRHLVEILESETQADILKLFKENILDIRKILHRAKSIRSYQGIDDDQSSFHFVNQSAAFGLVPSYEAQLLQSSAYQWAEKVAADELLTGKIELLSEKYALEEKLEGLLLDMDLKDEKLAELENAALLKDKKVTQLENDISSKEEKVTQLEQDILLKHDRIGILERDILLKDEHLLSKNERILGLESSFVEKAELKGLEDDSAVD